MMFKYQIIKYLKQNLKTNLILVMFRWSILVSLTIVRKMSLIIRRFKRKYTYITKVSGGSLNTTRPKMNFKLVQKFGSDKPLSHYEQVNYMHYRLKITSLSPLSNILKTIIKIFGWFLWRKRCNIFIRTRHGKWSIDRRKN